jgi:MFS family permease
MTALDQKTTLTSRLDRLPWGKFHTVVTVALSLGWALDAFETNIIGSVLGEVRKVWHLSPTQGSALVSSWVLGIFVGAVLFGHYSDLLGRKKMFIFTLVWYAGFSVATAFSWDFVSLLAFRFLAALGVGGEYSAVTAAMVEFIPRKHRGKASALILGAFPVGAMVSALLADYFLNHFSANVGWRLGFGAGAVLAILGVWVRYAIPESPRWLATHGRLDEAERVVSAVENSLAANAARLEPMRPVPQQPSVAASFSPALAPPVGAFTQGVRELFSQYLARLSMACSLNFAQASVVYGMLAVLSIIILPTVKVPSTQMPFFYFVGNLASLGGSLLAVLLIDTWGRKGTVTLGYIMTTLAMFFLYFAKTPGAVLAGYSAVMFCVIWASNTAYIVTSEILPVRYRATGLGISVAAGRIGAFSAPILLSLIYERTNKPGLALLLLTAMTLPGPIAAVIWCIKGTEAKHCSLEEVAREENTDGNGACGSNQTR